ncbi:TAXI family TRAP transporter solute-binding subunit [Microvirga massiliensis]|uniref:TAXI family TRAP transporter solute-binding subunit n=1 Tax=Microvirga massiliensis TaxID=1033741 RepID=UPI000B0D8417|nr:TAXI family TRAP transporter solute-binding subunit [Microvirga massiliensis]
MRALFPMYDTPFQFMVLEEYGIRSFAELNGKRVGVGPQGGTSGAYIPEFFKVMKIEATLGAGPLHFCHARLQAPCALAEKKGPASGWGDHRGPGDRRGPDRRAALCDPGLASGSRARRGVIEVSARAVLVSEVPLLDL